jgi:hypothetical protein
MNTFRRRGQDGAKSSGDLTVGEVGHSRNGTPLAEILYVRPAEDPLKWLMIPPHWSDGTLYEGPEDFAAQEAPELWALWKDQNRGVSDPDPLAVDRTRTELQYYAEKFGGFDPTRLFETITYLHVPSPTVSALPVRCWVDDGPGLTAELAALVVDPSAIEPPVVEPFHTKGLGKGIKATRHCLFDAEPGQDPDERQMWVAVRYAFKVPNRQAVVTIVATHTDLGRMAAAQPDLDEFVNTITLKHAGINGAPFPVTDG